MFLYLCLMNRLEVKLAGAQYSSSDVPCFRTSGFVSSSLPLRQHPCLAHPAIELCCVGVSATARLLSICELLLLPTAVAAFTARLFLGSESGGIGTSFFRLLWYCQLSCCTSDFLPSSDVFSLLLLRSPRSTTLFLDPSAQILLELF